MSTGPATDDTAVSNGSDKAVSDGMSELSKRVLSSIVLAPLGLASIWYGGLAVFLASTLCGMVMWWEWRQMSLSSSHITSFVFGAANIAASCWFALTQPLLIVPTLAAGLFTLTALSIIRSSEYWNGFGLLYTGIPVVSLVFLREQAESGLLLSLVLLALVWLSDIGAYFAGRGFGGPPLSPRDSPNKTWSGAIGALICSGLAGAAISGFRNDAVLPWILFAIGVSCVAQGGDLLESQFKRRFMVKDSSGLIPGHGGFLDRLDSLSAVYAVAMVAYLTFPSFRNLL